MPAGGTLAIDLSDVRDAGGRPCVRLRVTDDGTGMTPDVRERALEPFFSTKPKGRGTGLGLSTIYGIVTRAGGTVEIESAPGEGTSISVLLPATEAAAAEGTVEDDEHGAEASSETILVVEDEEAVRRLTCRILARQGYQALDAPGGRRALEIWGERSGDIDLLVTDVVMPGMSGKDLAEEIGVEPVFMSGYTDDVTLRHGVTGPRLVQKPFESETLLSAVREALDARNSSGV